MKDLIKNITKRIDRLIELSLDKWDGGASEKAYKICKDIIEEEAKKYNNGWIPCSERLPEEHDSIFAKYKGTYKWNNAMFEKISDTVSVTVADKNGNSETTYAHTVDGKWNCELLKCNKSYRIIAWQPRPKPYSPDELDTKPCASTECGYQSEEPCPAALGCAGYEEVN